LRRPSWSHEPVALGSNTDPYQPAEGRYRLMPGVIAALTGSGTPFSILTKGTTGRRHPELIDAYAKLYQNGSYVTRSYATDPARRSSVLLRKHGLDRKESMLRIPDTSTAAVPPHVALSEPSLF
jgi:hypothetical protein